MALIKCPECRKQVSDSADKCPKCGFDLSAYTLSPKIKQPSQEASPEETKKMGKGCLIAAIVILVIAGINQAITTKYAEYKETKRMGMPSFGNETLSAQDGKMIIERIYLEYPTVDSFYHKPILQGELFPDKVRVTLQLPANAWDHLTSDEKKQVGKYVSSYIPQVMRNPFAHTAISSSAPIASTIRENVQLLTYAKWTIEVGGLINGGADILPNKTIEPYQIR